MRQAGDGGIIDMMLQQDVGQKLIVSHLVLHHIKRIDRQAIQKPWSRYDFRVLQPFSGSKNRIFKVINACSYHGGSNEYDEDRTFLHGIIKCLLRASHKTPVGLF